MTDEQITQQTIQQLTEQGVLTNGATQWIIRFQDGREFDLVPLMVSFYKLGKEARI